MISTQENEGMQGQIVGASEEVWAGGTSRVVPGRLALRDCVSLPHFILSAVPCPAPPVSPVLRELAHDGRSRPS